MAICLALLGALGGCGGDHSRTIGGPGSSAKKHFYSAVFADNTFGRVDGTSISDEELLAGGRDFCDKLKAAHDTNTDKNLERPNFSDFGRIAAEVGSARFGAAKSLSGQPSANAQIVISYVVGGAAVRALCPQYTAALG